MACITHGVEGARQAHLISCLELSQAVCLLGQANLYYLSHHCLPSASQLSAAGCLTIFPSSSTSVNVALRRAQHPRFTATGNAAI